MGEVSIYQSRPYVSIDGRYRKAQETGQLDGVETRPANKQEREDWQIPEGDYFFRSEVYVRGASRPFVAWGRVHKAETIGGKGFKPVEKNPQRMAEKRAEAQALRKAFHIPLPSIEDIGSPDYDIESTVREVDTTTGEIPEAKEKEATKKPQQPAPEPVTSAGEPVEGETKAEIPAEVEIPASIGKVKRPDRDPESVKTLADLFKACHNDFGMQPKIVLKELGYSSQSDVSESPSECYQKIVELRCG
jgi:hypothetical protein